MSGAQTEAKRFLADRVIQQAVAEGLLLSEAERERLLWSESDPELTIDPTLPQRFAAETSDEEFERKIGGLLERSFSTVAIVLLALLGYRYLHRARESAV